MTRVHAGELVVGPWAIPLTAQQREIVDAMRMEAACQELATCTIRTDTTFSFTVALRPHRPLVEAA